MELAIRIHAEQLPKGPFRATSEELPSLVAQGCTVAEALDIARDVARKLIEARSGARWHSRVADHYGAPRRHNSSRSLNGPPCGFSLPRDRSETQKMRLRIRSSG